MNYDMNPYADNKLSEKSNQREVLAERSNNEQNVPYPTPKELLEKNEYLSKSNQMDENTIDEYIEILMDHQRNCERSGRYVEAEMARKRVKELKEKDDQGKKSQLKQKHMNEKMQLEEAHLNEFNQFNEFWDRKMEEFTEQAKTIEQQMLEKHQNELGRFVEEMDKVIPMKPKDSGELLNLRKIQESLGRQQNYIEAHKVQQRCLQMEKEEFEKWNKFRDKKLNNQRIQFEQKQHNELFALQKRITSGQDEQRKARAMELERLLQKYQNAKKELETQQQNEALKFEKNVQKTTNMGSMYRASGMKNSRYSTNSKQNTSTRK